MAEEEGAKQLKLYGSRNKRDIQLQLWLDLDSLKRLPCPSEQFTTEVKRIYDAYISVDSEKSCRDILADHAIDTIASSLVSALLSFYNFYYIRKFRDYNRGCAAILSK